MDLKKFHNPNISMPVIRRRVVEEMLELLGGIGEMAMTEGRSLLWHRYYKTKTPASYHSAIYRLKKAGLVISCGKQRQHPILSLTEKGKAQIPAIYTPEKFWRKKWSGIWYVLIYDVPEKDRQYRDNLRGFLERMRMGCLQKSVWVTPFDIRPEYDDLANAAAIQQYSYLLESTTVLGRSAQDIVCSAWKYEALAEVQRWYCEVYNENIQRIIGSEVSEEMLLDLAREELSAYGVAMDGDPLLPSVLWPREYYGEKVYALHQRITSEIAKRLTSLV
ncbi:MAG: hypothetical protein A2283_18700 [Lentisphaerae bacterium RIFOXYA12_FULL_48_11]|nr:MAG: hypothetical protein A2283_18700 [Lentisphaerae bacterium RIFOXYA12_FULL_48_11]